MSPIFFSTPVRALLLLSLGIGIVSTSVPTEPGRRLTIDLEASIGYYASNWDQETRVTGLIPIEGVHNPGHHAKLTIDGNLKYQGLTCSQAGSITTCDIEGLEVSVKNAADGPLSRFQGSPFANERFPCEHRPNCTTSEFEMWKGRQNWLPPVPLLANVGGSNPHMKGSLLQFSPEAKRLLAARVDISRGQLGLKLFQGEKPNQNPPHRLSEKYAFDRYKTGLAVPRSLSWTVTTKNGSLDLYFRDLEDGSEVAKATIEPGAKRISIGSFPENGHGSPTHFRAFYTLLDAPGDIGNLPYPRKVTPTSQDPIMVAGDEACPPGCFGGGCD